MPDDKEAPVYTAERIIQERKRKVSEFIAHLDIFMFLFFKGKTEYLIKWKGWTTK